MFIPPQELLTLNDGWARLAAGAILGDQHNQAVDHLSIRLELARQDGAFTLRHKPVQMTAETSRQSSYVLSSSSAPPIRTATRTTMVPAVRMLDLAQWAHQHGFPVVSDYAPFLSTLKDIDRNILEDELTQATSGRMGGHAKGKTNATRDAEIFKMYLELKGNTSWATLIQSRLECQGVTITPARIRQIVNNQKESEG